MCLVQGSVPVIFLSMHIEINVTATLQEEQHVQNVLHADWPWQEKVARNTRASEYHGLKVGKNTRAYC